MKKHHYVRGGADSDHGEAEISYSTVTGSRGWHVFVDERHHGYTFTFSRVFKSFAEAEEWLFSLGRRSKWQRV